MKCWTEKQEVIFTDLMNEILHFYDIKKVWKHTMRELFMYRWIFATILQLGNFICGM